MIYTIVNKETLPEEFSDPIKMAGLNKENSKVIKKGVTRGHEIRLPFSLLREIFFQVIKVHKQEVFFAYTGMTGRRL